MKIIEKYILKLAIIKPLFILYYYAFFCIFIIKQTKIMKKTEKITRRKLLRKIAGFLSLPVIAFWIKGIDQTKATSAKSKIILPNDLTEGFTFLDKIIIRKKGENIIVFSSSCTHLGCKINSEIDDKLICPCHGSKFNYDGYPTIGPAVKPLIQLELHKDNKTGEVIVYV